MPFAHHDHVVKAFSANRANHPLGIRVLPGRAGRNHRFSDVQPLGLTRKSFSINRDGRFFGRDNVARTHRTGGNVLFYLATPPDLFGGIVGRLGEAGRAREEQGAWRRVIVEKPFGRDLESARALNREIGRVLAEEQIYRIDHYLGKETVQNIMVLRFANGLLEPIWDRRYVDHVQMLVGETVGVEDRGHYYETAGVLRDRSRITCSNSWP